MLVGLVSDTHDNLKAISRIVDAFKARGVELVIHAGDWCAPFSMRAFSPLRCKLVGVYGNVDGEKLMLKKTAVEQGYSIEEFQEVEVEGIGIAVIHGVAEPIVEALASSGRYSLVVRGHTHKFEVKKRGECIIVNPGEACGYLTGRRTAVVVDIPGLQVELIEV